MTWTLPPAGFLSLDIDEAIPAIREANADLFDFSKEVNHLLMKLAEQAVNTVQTSSMEQGAVVVRLLLRGAGSFQGHLLMAERGMHVESRIMIRSVLEVSFAVAAILKNSDSFMRMLRDDHHKSRRQQYESVLKYSSLDEERLKIVRLGIAQVEKSLRLISPKALAEMGELEPSYLTYQMLSDNASHVSAASLDHYIEAFEGRKYWQYKVGAGGPDEIRKTLNCGLHAAIPVLVGAAEALEMHQFSDQLNAFVDRLIALPDVLVL
ncbi:hypothetical protein F3I62_16090 [Pseudomonas sp. R-28-1W-6]|uniref:DUF5677 domain-containing protein n=1 Tax=Pseudomonas sp. R-28-1W-6 TaxID=2650101 RepID=UPI001366787A|nr:DUF5677 domain-containing protein [Pseudomonas sp. R-28-1W-6]MWV13624.1 hypothetical protein [Pseudomonas sp. R-28-1W-6]